MGELSNKLRVGGEVGETASCIGNDLLGEPVAQSKALEGLDHGGGLAVGGHGETNGPGAKIKGNEDGHGVTGFATAFAVVTNPDLTQEIY